MCEVRFLSLAKNKVNKIHFKLYFLYKSTYLNTFFRFLKVIKKAKTDCIPIEFTSLVPYQNRTEIKTCDFPSEELFQQFRMLFDNAFHYTKLACTHFEYSGIVDTISGVDEGKWLHSTNYL